MRKCLLSAAIGVVCALLASAGGGIARPDGLLVSKHAREIMRRAKSAEMRHYMDTEAVPCDDYYQYACGNWPKINPAHGGKTDIFSVLLKAYKRKALKLLHGPKSTADTPMESRVKYFYESCLDRHQIKTTQRRRILRVLEEFGGMPVLKGDSWQKENFDWLEVVAKILRKYGKKIIIGVDIAADLINNEFNRLYIGQLDELVTSQALEYYAHLKIQCAYKLQQIWGLNSTLAAQTAHEMVEFEFRLAAGISEPHDGLGMEDKTRLRLLDEMSETYRPTLNFTRLVHIWLGYEYHLPVYEYVESYLWNLRKVIEKTPRRVLANYIMWQLVQELYTHVEPTAELQLTNCVDVSIKYFVKCIDRMIYVDLHAHKARAVQADVQQVWQTLKDAFEQLLQAHNTAWISETTRAKALEKLAAMRYEINAYIDENFEQEFGQLHISTSAHFQNLLNILQLSGQNFRQQLNEPPKLVLAAQMHFSPAYSSEFNKLTIPVSLLQPHYLWDDAYPTALRYATVGYIIAHEMAHGYDDNIRKYDAKGNFNNWWDRNSTREFAARKDCLRQQLTQFKYHGRHLPNSNAQGENIADNVAVRVAFTAYKRWLLAHGMANVTETLPQLSATPEQLFFLGLAQFWCIDINNEWRHVMTPADVHAPEQVRVQAMLANYDEFARVYACRLGTSMHPRRKCVIY